MEAQDRRPQPIRDAMGRYQIQMKANWLKGIASEKIAQLSSARKVRRGKLACNGIGCNRRNIAVDARTQHIGKGSEGS